MEQIENWSDLNDIRSNPGGSYELVNDLDSGTSGYSAYGDSWNNDIIFTGELHGNFYSIRDLVVYGNWSDPMGLFDEIDGGLVESIFEIQAEVEGGFGGILCDTARNGSLIQNVGVSGQVHGLDWGYYIGGLLGFAIGNVTIMGCVSEAAIVLDNDDNAVGGLLGCLGGSCLIENCRAESSIEADIDWDYGSYGGLVSQHDGTVNHSYAAVGYSAGNEDNAYGFSHNLGDNCAFEDNFYDRQVADLPHWKGAFSSSFSYDYGDLVNHNSKTWSLRGEVISDTQDGTQATFTGTFDAWEGAATDKIDNVSFHADLKIDSDNYDVGDNDHIGLICTGSVSKSDWTYLRSEWYAYDNTHNQYRWTGIWETEDGYEERQWYTVPGPLAYVYVHTNNSLVRIERLVAPTDSSPTPVSYGRGNFSAVAPDMIKGPVATVSDIPDDPEEDWWLLEDGKIHTVKLGGITWSVMDEETYQVTGEGENTTPLSWDEDLGEWVEVPPLGDWYEYEDWWWSSGDYPKDKDFWVESVSLEGGDYEITWKADVQPHDWTSDWAIGVSAYYTHYWVSPYYTHYGVGTPSVDTRRWVERPALASTTLDMKDEALYQGVGWSIDPISNWEVGVSYGVGTIVVSNRDEDGRNYLYRCISSHTSEAHNQPMKGVKWMLRWEDADRFDFDTTWWIYATYPRLWWEWPTSKNTYPALKVYDGVNDLWKWEQALVFDGFNWVQMPLAYYDGTNYHPIQHTIVIS